MDKEKSLGRGQFVYEELLAHKINKAPSSITRGISGLFSGLDDEKKAVAYTGALIATCKSPDTMAARRPTNMTDSEIRHSSKQLYYILNEYTVVEKELLGDLAIKVYRLLSNGRMNYRTKSLGDLFYHETILGKGLVESININHELFSTSIRLVTGLISSEDTNV